MLLSLLPGDFIPPLLVGLSSRFTAKSLRGLPAGFNDLFSGFDDFLAPPS